MIDVMMKEIREIPDRARDFLAKSEAFKLPHHVPYVGMGSSYFAAMALYQAGFPVIPVIASEFFHYISKGHTNPEGVLISQSGESTDVLLCGKLFKKFWAITNHESSELARHAHVEKVISLHAGKEEASSTKTYVNTLLALHQGLGTDISRIVPFLKDSQKKHDIQGKALAAAITGRLKRSNIKGIFLVGSGPSLATAHQASLILSESTNLVFQGISLGQYDHGFKETAKDSIVIFIRTTGHDRNRIEHLMKLVEQAGATVLQTGDQEIDYPLHPIAEIVPLCYTAVHLAAMIGVKSTFTVGKKITKT